DGYRLEGDLYVSGRTVEGAVVFCTGWGGSRGVSQISALMATGIVERVDCAVLDFDYSGWGRSEGPRQRLDPGREVRDARAAVSLLLQRFPTLRAVALYGISFGGGIATYAAACDPRVAGVVSVSGYTSGEAFLRDMRPHWQFVEFEERLARDRLTRSITGKSELVDPDEILQRDPEAKAFNEQLKQQYPQRVFQLDLISADLVMEFDVLSRAPLLQNRPSLFIHAKRDLLIPWQQSEKVAEAAGGRLVVMPGVGHYDLYEGPPFIRILDESGEFLLRIFTPS
ncbi:MAG TPA: alpha/beta fold hydrolase, partial [Gemmatimonadaceae bacterium]|nr:alpha/beta fold hydrolase [Gemmatimonadaceae bacterium]